MLHSAAGRPPSVAVGGANEDPAVLRRASGVCFASRGGFGYVPQTRQCPDLRENRSGHRGGGGNRTRVLRLLNRPSPSAAGGGLSGSAPLPAAVRIRIRLSCPWPPVGAVGQVSPTRWRPNPVRGTEAGRTSQFLGCERELRLGVYFLFRLFNVGPETTARFSYIDDQSRSLSPPGCSSDRTRCPTETSSLPLPGPAGSVGQRTLPLAAARASRAASRPASLVAMAWRLSYCRRPLARATSTFARPSLK